MSVKPPPEGTTLEAWRFVTALRAARSKRNLPPVTIGLASTRHLTILIAESGLDEELWSRIPEHAAETEKRVGVTFRQLFYGPRAGLIFEGLVDEPWSSRDDALTSKERGDRRREQDYRHAKEVRSETVDLGMAAGVKSVPDLPSPENQWKPKMDALAALAAMTKEKR